MRGTQKTPCVFSGPDCRLRAGQRVIPADLLLWYELALKMALTAAIVVGASVAVERSGPFIGALIATLPTAAGAAYIILALEHPPAFIAASAIGSAATNAVVAIFALTYAWLAQRHGVLLSITVAILVWFCAAAALRLIEWDSGARPCSQCAGLCDRPTSLGAVSPLCDRTQGHQAHAL